MKRTQMYIDETLFHRLSLISREQKTTISALVRKAIEQVYGKKQAPEARVKALQAVSGIWKKRKDLAATEDYIRSLRQDSRSKRLGLK